MSSERPSSLSWLVVRGLLRLFDDDEPLRRMGDALRCDPSAPSAGGGGGGADDREGSVAAKLGGSVFDALRIECCDGSIGFSSSAGGNALYRNEAEDDEDWVPPPKSRAAFCCDGGGTCG